MPEAIQFGAKLRELRTERGYTQEQLAERAAMNSLQIGHLERGSNDPKLSTIIKLASALEIDAAELIPPAK